MSNSSFFKDGGGSSTTTASIQNQVDAAVAAKEAAQTAKTAAELAETNAESAETNASGSASAAAGSATAAAGSATTATNKAAEAAASESAASDFATAAAGSATSASNTLANTVTLNTSQTISGAKVFSANTDFGAGIDVTGNITVTGTVDGVDVAALSSSVSNVDNTSDANKPISTATQTALDLKAPIASPTFTGTVTADALDIDGDAVFTSSNTNDQVTIENTSTSTFSAPDLKFKRTGAVGQTSNIGVIGFDALNSTPANFAYANIVVDSTNITAGSETGTIKLQVHDPADGNNYPVPRLSVDKDGIDVTGTVTADALTIDGDSVINGEVDIQHEHKLRFKQSDESTDQLVIDTSGTNSRIQETGGGHLYITGDRILLQESSSSTDKRINIGDNNGVKIYGDNKLRIVTGNGTYHGAGLADSIFFYTGDGDAVDHKTMSVSPTGIDVTGTTTSDRFTGSQTHNIQSGAETMSGHVGQKTINYGASGTVVYTFPDVADGDKGDTWTVVNASDHDITCNRTSTSVFDKLSAGSDAVSANTVTIAKGGVAEFVVTAANVITVFGSGIS